MSWTKEGYNSDAEGFIKAQEALANAISVLQGFVGNPEFSCVIVAIGLEQEREGQRGLSVRGIAEGEEEGLRLLYDSVARNAVPPDE